MSIAIALVRTALLGVVLPHGATTHAAAVDADHLRIELVSETSALVPGRTAWLGLRLRHDPHWHTYWINPGDSGLPTRVNWTLPDGYRAGAIAWPAPTRFVVGGLYNFGYADAVLLPVPLHVPATAEPGTRVALAVEAKWLVCEEECIPGKADLHLELPVATLGESPPAGSATLFAKARASTPGTTDWTGSARITDGHVEVRLRGDDLPGVDGLDVFTVQRRLLGNAPATLRREGDTLHIQAALNDSFVSAPAELELVLTSAMTNGAPASWRVRVPFAGDVSSRARDGEVQPHP